MRIRSSKSSLSFPLVIIVGLIIIQFNACSDSNTPDTDFLLTIVGKVTDKDTGLPIEGATLKLYVTTIHNVHDVRGTATTDSNGDYKLTGKHNCDRVPQVLARADGYLEDEVAVHCKEETQTVNFQLMPRS